MNHRPEKEDETRAASPVDSQNQRNTDLFNVFSLHGVRSPLSVCSSQDGGGACVLTDGSDVEPSVVTKSKP